MAVITYTTLREYIDVQIELFTLLKAPSAKLRQREKDVFIEYLMCAIDKIDINSATATSRIRDTLNFLSATDVWQYKHKLHKKGWLKKVGERLYKIQPTFDYVTKDVVNSKKYSFTITYTSNIPK